VTDRHPELPAASYARIVTTVLPISSGTSAAHDTVPEASPASPFEVLHLTPATPVSSLAVPAKWRLAEVVETIVAAGVTTFREGGVVSTTGGCDGGCTGG